MSTVTDFLVFLWPTRTLSHLNLPFRKRISLIFAFNISGIVCIAGVLRIVFVGLRFGSGDLSYDSATTITIGVIEINVGIICASLPGCRPVSRELSTWLSSLSDRFVGRVTRTLASLRILSTAPASPAQLPIPALEREWHEPEGVPNPLRETAESTDDSADLRCIERDIAAMGAVNGSKSAWQWAETVDLERNMVHTDSLEISNVRRRRTRSE